MKEHLYVVYKYRQIESICKRLIKATRACDHDSFPMSFLPQRCTPDTASNEQNLDQLLATYMYSVIFKDIMLEIDDEAAKAMDTLSEYERKRPVWWYTKPIFMYGVLNRALRMLDMEVVTKLGFFIRHLHIQLEKLHQEQSANFHEVFIVYRGQWLSQPDFQNLIDSKGGLLSFNNFLSTNKTPFTYFVSLFESV
ncbi:unnamed protein product [Rotaria magnacalcarata]|uniref:Uncharacterized protein n=1 Tax=Rotaria magnacalcarata TaxID=392030 RepID=A0A816M4P2_9BILA|nr:unnamed protein product [Rotaria magnacalcarata]